MGQPSTDAIICPWVEGVKDERAAAELDRIFFDSSATKAFASDAARAAFRERWLGRYLERFPGQAYVAVTGAGRVVGYVVGSLDDPAKSPVFQDLTYFAQFAALTATFPAQLHVNVAEDQRGHGVGARLVQRFIEDAHRHGAPGVHVVTSRGMRNVGFYLANGFHEAGSLVSCGRELLFLGRRLI